MITTPTAKDRIAANGTPAPTHYKPRHCLLCGSKKLG